MGITCRVLIYFGNVGCCVDFECFGDKSGMNMEVKIRLTSAKVRRYHCMNPILEMDPLDTPRFKKKQRRGSYMASATTT